MPREEEIKEIEHTVECCKMYLTEDDPWILTLNIAVSALRAQADTPPNDPLTLEELREMDGEPVWVIFYASYGETVGMWALVSIDEYTREVFLTNSLGGRSMYEEAIVDIKAIYCHKPEEGTM